MGKGLVILLALLLTACAAPPLEVGSITSIKAPPGTTGVDIYAAKRDAGQQVPAYAGDQLVEVRTFTESNANKLAEEFPGAACSLSADNFSADFTTPAKIRVPLYRGQSSTLSVSCKKDGFLATSEQTAVFNATQASRTQAGSGGGLIGVAFALAWNGLADSTNDDYRYSDVRITMKRTPLQTAQASK